MLRTNAIASIQLIANDFPGADIGAQINAADTYLGALAGTIFVLPGNYTIATPVHLGAAGRFVRAPLWPKMSTATRTALSLTSNDEGRLVVWDTDLHKPFAWDGSALQAFW